MWDFDTFKTLAAMRATFPFILFRLLIYIGIGLAYALGIGTGAGLGYAFTAFAGDPGSGAGIGGILGFGAVSGVLYWAREYLLYLVKAGHIAVLVKVLQGETLPGGKGQIDYAQGIVRQRFAEASSLFLLDQIVKGVLRAVNGLLMTISFLLPIPALEGLMRMVQRVLNLSLTYVDEIILAYSLRTESTNPWAAGKDGLILYAQNYKAMLKNAFFLMIIQYGLALLIFLLILGPVAVLVGFISQGLAPWAVPVAIVFAWSFKAALLEPFAVAALMQAYFKLIEGQRPNPEWDEKLSRLSSQFRELKEKALGAG
ncbi:MAG: hypothetical protein A2286_05090 [Gammaproteobacteria bacterium RIFOXYA12_FULL_61_12]|nr:MAG: hypothetical protein A2514_01600 [Gammaproteobacteria bacterium RIFOXYD12_FULL_61_37]OGT93694.1 MAG: hypothetical protein A2286_05090 [Gammaproteobacteria bacterium RIFOXYA12_FULL_61_12]